MASKDAMRVFLDLTDRLVEASIQHDLKRFRDDALSIVASVPGEYWEIDVLNDGSLNVEVFKSDGLEDDPAAAIDRLIAESSD